MNWAVAIVVAVITGPVVVLLQMLRRENTTQHGESRELLHHMVIKVDDINENLNTHIKEHNNGNQTK
jgi:hypothetical protein